MEHQIEVIVTKLKTRYKATCPLFPECKGVGASEEKALLKLSSGIAKLISKMAESNLQKLFLSNRYTEVILDTTQTKKEQKRVFQPGSFLSPTPAGFGLRLKVSNVPFENPQHKTDELSRIMSEMEEIVIAQALPGGVGGMELSAESNTEEDVFGFGVPMSFN